MRGARSRGAVRCPAALSRLQLISKLFSIKPPIELARTVYVYQVGYFPRCGTKLARAEQRRWPVCVFATNRPLLRARSAGLEPATFSVRSHSPSQTRADTEGHGETKQRFYRNSGSVEGHGGTGRDTRLRSDCGQNLGLSSEF